MGKVMDSKLQGEDGNHISCHLKDHLERQRQKQEIEREKALISVVPGLSAPCLFLTLAV